MSNVDILQGLNEISDRFSGKFMTSEIRHELTLSMKSLFEKAIFGYTNMGDHIKIVDSTTTDDIDNGTLSISILVGPNPPFPIMKLVQALNQPLGRDLILSSILDNEPLNIPINISATSSLND